MIIKRLITKWKNQKIRAKLTEAILIAGALPVLIMALAFGSRLNSMITADTVRNQQSSSAAIAPLISQNLDRIADTMEELLADDFLVMLTDSATEKTWKELADSAEAKQFAAEVGALSQQELPVTVRIYAELPDSTFYTDEELGSIFASESEIKGTYWHGIFDSQHCTKLYCPQLYLGIKESASYGDCAYIVKKQILCADTLIPAYVVIYYDSALFTDIMEKGLSVSGSVTYIINDREAIVATTDVGLSGLYRINYSDIEESLLDSSSFVEKTVAGNEVYVSFDHITGQNWYMVSVIPKQQVILSARKILYSFLAIAAFFIVLALVIALTLASSITNRLGEFEKQMRLATEDTLSPMPEPEIHDEVGSLISGYNYMTGKINDLMEEKEKNAEELRIAEFNSLQAQINPHFLYNTLDMINWMALQGKTEEVSDTVKDLAKFYRLTLSRKKKYSTIRDELDHGEVYIHLQNRRFNDTIDLIVDVPDELTEYRIPRLTFQPILENSIIHGILGKEEKSGTIVITAWDEEKDIVIVISDDGVGMDEELVSQILSPDRTVSSGGTNIAVINVHRRLQLLYGDGYGLSYASVKGQGCEVTIRIPKHLGDSTYVRS